MIKLQTHPKKILVLTDNEKMEPYSILTPNNHLLIIFFRRTNMSITPVYVHTLSLV